MNLQDNVIKVLFPCRKYEEKHIIARKKKSDESYSNRKCAFTNGGVLLNGVQCRNVYHPADAKVAHISYYQDSLLSRIEE